MIAEIDTSAVERGLRGLLRAGTDISPVLRGATTPLRRDIRDHQQQQEGPRNARWPAHAQATRRKQARGRSGRRRTQRMLGRLPRLATVRVVGRDTLVARSRVRWARVHQEGGRVGHGATIPPRVWLYFGEDFVDDLEQAVVRYLAGAWEG
ncbi:MAG: phage virion morphogenesis protein [Proteobacteria bacterium]|nr:phage virion morphogenesis protein [Pseudomonadota bacterium]